MDMVYIVMEKINCSKSLKQGLTHYNNYRIYMGQWANGLRNGYGEIYSNKNTYFFGYFSNNIQNGFFMFYNSKSKKIIIGFNRNGIIDRLVKIFRNKSQPKLILIKKGKKIKEIENEDNINTFLNELDNSDQRKSLIKDICFKNYFYMKREELEQILIEKCNPEDIDEINGRLGKNIKLDKKENLIE